MIFKSNIPPTKYGTNGFTRAELESWLYQIAFNNCGNSLGNACEEIISRLDGFERFVEDKRKEADNGKE